jgi:hypothetical protein
MKEGFFSRFQQAFVFKFNLHRYNAAQNFKTGRFPHVWPIKLLRFFVAIFFTLFYVSTLGGAVHVNPP